MKRKMTATRKWIQGVKTDALHHAPGLFTWKDPKRIARELKRAALASDRLQATPFRSAMSYLNFYINRAGKKLDPLQRAILQKAKVELRLVFHKIKTRHVKSPFRASSKTMKQRGGSTMQIQAEVFEVDDSEQRRGGPMNLDNLGGNIFKDLKNSFGEEVELANDNKTDPVIKVFVEDNKFKAEFYNLNTGDKVPVPTMVRHRLIPPGRSPSGLYVTLRTTTYLIQMI